MERTLNHQRCRFCLHVARWKRRQVSSQWREEISTYSDKGIGLLAPCVQRAPHSPEPYPSCMAHPSRVQTHHGFSPEHQKITNFNWAIAGKPLLPFCRKSSERDSREEEDEMATAYAPMASQVMKSGLVHSRPRGLSGAALTRRPRFTVKAIQPEKPTYQVVQPINGDPFIGSLETPVTSSPLVAWYLSNLPAYRTAVNPLLRGIEVGLAHGYLLVGPFALTGPLRNTPVHGQAGALGAIGLVTILSVCLTMYGVASFNEGDPSTAPTLTLTGRKKEADKLQTADGWAKFTGGFFFGGVSGAIWAYFLLYVLDLPYYFK